MPTADEADVLRQYVEVAKKRLLSEEERARLLESRSAIGLKTAPAVEATIGAKNRPRTTWSQGWMVFGPDVAGKLGERRLVHHREQSASGWKGPFSPLPVPLHQISSS